MRFLLRAGAVALAAGTTLIAGSTVFGGVALAAPAADLTVKASRLVFEPGVAGHTGSLRIVVRNTSAEAFSGGIIITEPLRDTIGDVQGASGCGLGRTEDGRTTYSCPLDAEIPAGGRSLITVTFRSPSKPEAFAQAAQTVGKVEVGGAVAEYRAIFRSTTGSLRNPQPYAQDAAPALTVTAGDVTLAEQPDGTFSGRTTVTVRNNGDAAHSYLGTEVVAPEVLGWPGIKPSETCAGASDLPVPPGSSGIGCTLSGGQLAEGGVRTFDWVFTAPAGTAPGVLGSASTLVKLAHTDAQPDGANVATFQITVAG